MKTEGERMRDIIDDIEDFVKEPICLGSEFRLDLDQAKELLEIIHTLEDLNGLIFNANRAFSDAENKK